MPKPIKIVMVEDHEALREVMVDHLNHCGYFTVGAWGADEMDDYLAQDDFDILVLDLQLPGEDGLSIAKRLKRSKPNMFIIMMTAKSSESAKIHGYNAGADIYLTKPTTPELLTAAIASLSHRVIRDESTMIKFDITGLVILGKTEVQVTKQEALILKALLESPSQMLHHTRLIELIGREFSESGKANLEVQITRLRKKLIEVGVNAPAIKAIRNQGYQLLSNNLILSTFI